MTPATPEPEVEVQQLKPLPEVPEGWIAQRSEQHGGACYFVNLFNGQSSWQKPRHPALTAMSTEEIRSLLGPSADKLHLRRELEDALRNRLAERNTQQASQRGSLPKVFQKEHSHWTPPPESLWVEAAWELPGSITHDEHLHGSNDVEV